MPVSNDGIMSTKLQPPTEATWDTILTELAERRTEFHEQGYVSRDFIENSFKLGIFRHATPTRFGGEPMSTSDFLKIIERFGRVDGSAAWVIGFASSNTYLGALPLDTQAKIYAAGPDIVHAGGLFPMAKAIRTEDGYRVSGRWKFASGCMAADYISVGLIDEAAGGKPRAAIVPKEQVRIIQDWDVSGMRASGSFDTEVEDVIIPFEWTFVRGGEPLIDEPLFQYPLIGYQAQCHAAVGLGVAQGALDYAQHAGSYRGITGAPPAGERAYYRYEFSRAYAALNSARSWFLDVADNVWETVNSGQKVSSDQKAQIRLSATHVSDISAQVVHDVSKISGAKIIGSSHTLNLIRLDAQVPQLHVALSQHVYDDAGAVLLGLQPTTPGFL